MSRSELDFLDSSYSVALEPERGYGMWKGRFKAVVEVDTGAAKEEQRGAPTAPHLLPQDASGTGGVGHALRRRTRG